MQQNPQPFSLSLNEDILQVAKGVWNKKGFKIASYALASLPQAMTSRGEITQQKQLAQMIKTLMAKAKPKPIVSNFCYLNLADELVFSKFMRLPKVKKDELESAIFYKIKDFLPHKPQELYLDWQLLKDGEKSHEVNVVAVERKIIDSYLQSLAQVSVFPLGFEPESVSLARLSHLSSPEPSLVVCFNEKKVTFSFVEKGVVLLTSSLQFGSGTAEQSFQEVLLQFSKSARFWQSTFGENKQIKNVFLAGMVPNDLVLQQEIKKDFKAQVQKLSLPLILPSEFPQDRLIKSTPFFGLMLTQINEKEGKSIRLIPPEVKEARESFNFKQQLKNVLKANLLVLAGFLALYSFVFLSLFFQLQKTEASLSGWEKVVTTPTQLRIEKQAVNLNQKLSVLDRALQREKKHSLILQEFIKTIPPGIVINEFSFNPAAGQISIRGIASSRQDLLSLEKALASLGSVSIPLSSFATQENPAFIAMLTLK